MTVNDLIKYCTTTKDGGAILWILLPEKQKVLTCDCPKVKLYELVISIKDNKFSNITATEKGNIGHFTSFGQGTLD